MNEAYRFIHHTPWERQEVQGCEGNILVKQYEVGHCEVCGAMSHMQQVKAKHQQLAGTLKLLFLLF